MKHSKTATLFCSAPGRVGVLITRRGKKQRVKVLHFKDGHSALTWCERNFVILVYMPEDQNSHSETALAA